MLDLLIGLQDESVLLLSLDIFPESDLISLLVGLWDQVDGGIETQVSLEVSALHVHEGVLVSIGGDDSW